MIALAAPALAVAGLSQIGAFSVFPGTRTGLDISISRVKDGDSLQIAHATRDLKAMLRMWIVRDSARWTSVIAVLDDGTELRAHPRARSDSIIELEITGPDSANMRRPKFAWPSGRDVNVVIRRAREALPAGARPLPTEFFCARRARRTVASWRLDVSDGDFDSCGRAHFRAIGFAALLTVFVVAMIGLFIREFTDRRQPPAPIAAEDVIQSLVATLKADDETESNALQQLARNLLIKHMSRADALAEMGVEPGNMASYGRALRLSDQLIDRLGQSLGEFQRSLQYYQRQLATLPDLDA
jgi:hypothetical protein